MHLGSASNKCVCDGWIASGPICVYTGGTRHSADASVPVYCTLAQGWGVIGRLCVHDFNDLGTVCWRRHRLWRWCQVVVGKMRNCGMRNAESKMRNRKCGMTLIGRTVKSRDRCHSAYYRKSAMTSQTGRAVKCGMRKCKQWSKIALLIGHTHCKSLGLPIRPTPKPLTLQKFLLIYIWQFYYSFNFQRYGVGLKTA